MAHGDLSVGNDAAGTGDHTDNTVGARRISHRFGALHYQPGNRIEVCGSDPAVLLLLCGGAVCDKGKKAKLPNNELNLQFLTALEDIGFISSKREEKDGEYLRVYHKSQKNN